METSFELDWTWFCESYLKLLKNGSRTWIFRKKKLVFSRKKGRKKGCLILLWYIKMFWMRIMNFNLVLLWKLEFFEKRQNHTNFVKFWDQCELAYETYMYTLLHSYVTCVYTWLRHLNLFTWILVKWSENASLCKYRRSLSK